MVDHVADPEGRRHTFVIKPNCSLSFMGVVILALFILLLLSIISVGFYLLDAWPVVPFTGLEGVLIIFLLILVWWRTHYTEEVSISPDVTRVIFNGWRPTRYWRFPTVDLVLLKLQHGGYHQNFRLYLRCDATEVEIGARIAQHERMWLADQLEAVLVHCARDVRCVEV